MMKGNHQLLLPRLMSSKVLDGAEKMLMTRCICDMPGVGATIWPSDSLMIPPLEFDFRLSTSPMDGKSGCAVKRLHFLDG
jgi:hypothetical protein